MDGRMSAAKKVYKPPLPSTFFLHQTNNSQQLSPALQHSQPTNPTQPNPTQPTTMDAFTNTFQRNRQEPPGTNDPSWTGCVIA